MFSRKEKLLLFSLAFVQFSHIVDFMIIMPLGPQLMRLFSIVPSQFGMLVSAYTFSAGVSGVLSAFFIDRFDRKKALLFFYVGFCIGTVACAIAENYHGLLLARTVTGAFGGVLSSLSFAMVGDAIDANRRGTAMGILMASFSFASIAGVPFSLYLANKYDWHAPFAFLGILSILLTAFINFSIPSMRGHVEKKLENPWLVVKSFFLNTNQRLAILFMSCLVLGQFSVIPFLSGSLVANAGLTEAQLPLIYLVGGFVSMFSSPAIGRLSDLFGKRKLFLICSAFSIIPFYLITNLGPTPLPWLLATVVLFFLAMGGRMVPAQALITGTVKANHRGSFMSIISSVQQFSSAIAAFVTGHMVIKSPQGPILHYSIAGYTAIVLTVIAWLLAFRIHPSDGSM